MPAWLLFPPFFPFFWLLQGRLAECGVGVPAGGRARSRVGVDVGHCGWISLKQDPQSSDCLEQASAQAASMLQGRVWGWSVFRRACSQARGGGPMLAARAGDIRCMRSALSGWCAVYLADSDSQLGGRHVRHLRDVAEAVAIPLVPAHNPRAETQLHHHTHTSMTGAPWEPFIALHSSATNLMLQLAMRPPASRDKQSIWL